MWCKQKHHYKNQAEQHDYGGRRRAIDVIAQGDAQNGGDCGDTDRPPDHVFKAIGQLKTDSTRCYQHGYDQYDADGLDGRDDD